MFSWKIVCFISAFYTAGLIVLDFFLPETPYFLLTQTDTSNEVEQTLRRLRGDNYDMSQELDEIIDFKATNEISKWVRRFYAYDDTSIYPRLGIPRSLDLTNPYPEVEFQFKKILWEFSHVIYEHYNVN